MTEDTSSKDTEVSTTLGRQRKKRKWDQPAEPLVAAGVVIPGVPFTSNAILGSTLTGAFPLSASLFTNPILMPSINPLEMVQSPLATQSAATIIQNLSQTKIQDEVIAREIVINDAESSIRYKLTKRQTQEEIQKCTGAVVITRGKYRPPNGLPDNEKPLYLHISSGANIKDIAERIRAVDHAAAMVEEIMQHGQIPLGTQILSTCLFLGFDAEPSLNISARIRGPNDLYINHIMNETGATVVLRGRGSEHLDSSHTEEALQPLHLYLSSSNPKCLEAAKILAENLLDTVARECGTSRISSTKVYGAVPPPQQLLAGTESSLRVVSAGNSNQIPVISSTATGIVATTQSYVAGVATASGTVFQSVEQLKYGNSQSSVSYALPGVTSVTCYNGYEGIYPQATPLQQVALALRQASSSSTAISSTNSLVSTAERKSSSVAEADTHPLQKRKFKELPVTSKWSTPLQNSQQGSEFLKPGLEDSVVKLLSSMPRKKTLDSGCNGMPPPPPRIMPPPPPKFSSSRSLPKTDNAKEVLTEPSAMQESSRNMPQPPKCLKAWPPTKVDSGNVDTKKLAVQHLSDTLLKLAEYGDDDEEEVSDPSVGLLKSSPVGNSMAKPFWAV
ncbi:protein RIK-like [Curcuma longa]|uniref:protein RIK-like n=1 Tax=Curcuma longa TaxID=136217 RepID=UPI003D9F20A8